MQEAVPDGEGGMAAVLGVDADILAKICAEAAENEVVAPANYNAPGQIVIAGNSAAVDRAVILAKEHGAKRAMRLPVSAPFHCSLMVPAGERLGAELERIAVHPLAYPLVSNVEASPYSDCNRTVELLVQQVSAPVRWEESVRCMLAQGVETFYRDWPRQGAVRPHPQNRTQDTGSKHRRYKIT